MTLRRDSVYRVDLSSKHDSLDSRSSDNESPPKIVQIRLSEQVLHKLVAVHARTGDTGKLSIAIDDRDPVLMIGSVAYPLQTPLAGSTSAAATPAELFRLSEDETTLLRLGPVTTKLSIKPMSNVSVAAQKLKHQREEEEIRKQERKRAVMSGSIFSTPANAKKNATVRITSHSSSRPVNRTPISGEATMLSRSASLNKLPTRRSLQNTSSKFASREHSPSVHDSFVRNDAVDKLGRTSYKPESSPRISERVATPQGPELKPSQPDEDMVSDSGGDSDQDPRKETTSLPSKSHVAKGGTGALESKLSTRQRLVKAAKGGSRTLAHAHSNASQPTGQSSMHSTVVAASSASVGTSFKAASGVEPGGHRRTMSTNSIKIFDGQTSPRLSDASRYKSSSNDARHVRSSSLNKLIPVSENAPSSVQDVSVTRKRRRSNDQLDDSIPARKALAFELRAGSEGAAPGVKPKVSALRPTEGVGSGATHRSEPWLDVRTTADWHKLAERFTKTLQEYTAARQSLTEEQERLEAESRLLAFETANVQTQVASQSKMAKVDTKGMHDSKQANRSRRSRSDDSIEEGETCSSDEDSAAQQPVSDDTRQSHPHIASLALNDELEHLVWRQAYSDNDGNKRSWNQARQRGPMPYKELSDTVAGLHAQHGSLSRMHHVLITFKKREQTA